MNLIGATHWNRGVNNLVFMGHEMNPLLVFGHGNGTFAKLVYYGICVVCFALENASISIIRLLDFSNDDGFELATRAFEIQVSLFELT